jgi:6-phosphogluconate dehydrogenase
MHIGVVGLGRMGGGIAERLHRGGHSCVVFDADRRRVEDAARHGAVGVASLEGLCERLEAPRYVWLMLPAAVVDEVIQRLLPKLAPGDVVIDGGNSHYHDDLRRAAALGARGVHYVDVGVSGGVHGFERGYCLMIGGEKDVVTRLSPIFAALAPGVNAVPRTPGRTGESIQAEHGYLHCGPAGAGHFVKMVHNGIEYGLMEAYAEGLNLLRSANAGRERRAVDAESAPLERPELYRYDFDLAAIAEVWRRGSVLMSFLLDLTASALGSDPSLSAFSGRVSDSGEGRFMAKAAIDTGVPTPVLGAALASRFASRGHADFARKVLSAMRFEFGGHEEKQK